MTYNPNAVAQQTAPRLPAPTRLGQATAVEQSRAVAEVQAAIVVAQQCPRDVQTARAAMLDTCGYSGMADRAFYRFPRAGQTITGPSVHLARELARCWGNVQYGVSELRRDDEAAQSEMQAWAWDVQTNTRSVLTFVVPHKRDTSSGAKPLVDMRDIYENNANAGARRLREAIFAILPAWFIEEAKERCNATLTKGGDKPIADQVDEAIGVFAGLGVTADQMERKIGRVRSEWTAYDMAQFRVIHRSLRRGEVTVAEEFPPVRVTPEEVKSAGEPSEPAVPPAPPAEPEAPTEEPAGEPAPQPEPAPEPEPQAPPVTQQQLKKIAVLMNKHGLAERDEALLYVNEVLGRHENPIDSRNQLTRDEAGRVIDALEKEETRS